MIEDRRRLRPSDGLSSGSSDPRGGILRKSAKTLAFICEAVTGERVRIRSDMLLYAGMHASDGPGDHGITVYLPDTVRSFSLLKLMALHQARLARLSPSSSADTSGFVHAMEDHLRADAFLLSRLPGLRNEMRETAGGTLPPGYPREGSFELEGPMPWWSEFGAGPDGESADRIQRAVQMMAAENGLSEETLEGIFESFADKGERDAAGCWRKIRELFDGLDLPSPYPEDRELDARTFFYDEWDEPCQRYRPDWCRVLERAVPGASSGFADRVLEEYAGHIAFLRRSFLYLKPELFRKLKAQTSGDAFDLDALVQAVVDLRSTGSPPDAVYIRREKRIRDVAVLFLLDTSVSTGETVSGKRIIDLEKEAMILMAEALDSLKDPYAVFGFHSEGRHRVHLLSIKGFDEEYGPEVQHRIGRLEPGRQTRLAAAIRHGAHLMSKVEAATRLMLVLTDGKPYDLDYGKLEYALADTKKALEETRGRGIRPFVIIPGEKEGLHLGALLPPTQYIILPDIEHLPLSLPAVYKRLAL